MGAGKAGACAPDGVPEAFGTIGGAFGTFELGAEIDRS
jgi:hypothetical protein